MVVRHPRCMMYTTFIDKERLAILLYFRTCSFSLQLENELVHTNKVPKRSLYHIPKAHLAQKPCEYSQVVFLEHKVNDK